MFNSLACFPVISDSCVMCSTCLGTLHPFLSFPIRLPCRCLCWLLPLLRPAPPTWALRAGSPLGCRGQAVYLNEIIFRIVESWQRNTIQRVVCSPAVFSGLPQSRLWLTWSVIPAFRSKNAHVPVQAIFFLVKHWRLSSNHVFFCPLSSIIGNHETHPLQSPFRGFRMWLLLFSILLLSFQNRLKDLLLCMVINKYLDLADPIWLLGP